MKRLMGWRKTGYWLLTLTAMSIGAWKMHGTFTEYRDGIITLAGFVLAAHVTQQKLSPPAPANPVGGPA